MNLHLKMWLYWSRKKSNTNRIVCCTLLRLQAWRLSIIHLRRLSWTPKKGTNENSLVLEKKSIQLTFFFWSYRRQEQKEAYEQAESHSGYSQCKLGLFFLSVNCLLFYKMIVNCFPVKCKNIVLTELDGRNVLLNFLVYVIYFVKLCSYDKLQ